MFIYKITNKINNKVYIGQSIRPIEKRFQRHINDALNNIIDTHFSRAIRKYGKDNFYVELIDKAENQEELNNKEQYWFIYYESTNDRIPFRFSDASFPKTSLVPISSPTPIHSSGIVDTLLIKNSKFIILYYKVFYIILHIFIDLIS